MPRVIVSAGHTQDSPGKEANGLREVDLSRSIARKLVPYLRSNGVITLSVPPNMELSKRVDWINGTGYTADLKDISIEIHINGRGKTGFEAWYGGANIQESQDLAQKIIDIATADNTLPSQGVHSETEHEFGTLAFINKTRTLSVILECLDIDSPQDAQKLQTEAEIDKIAKSIAKGILAYLNLPFREARVAPAQVQKPAVVANTSMPTTPIATQPVPVSPTTTTPQQLVSRPGIPTGVSRPGLNRIPAQPQLPPQPQLTREQRQEMITMAYKKTLGRSPSDNDLNYFVNIAITEDKLLKRMIDSQEHLDMLKAYKEYNEIKDKFQGQQMELTQIKAEYQDALAMINNLKQLLHQKNKQLSQHRRSFGPSDIAISGVGATQTSQMHMPQRKYKPSFSDRIFHFFSGILG